MDVGAPIGHLYWTFVSAMFMRDRQMSIAHILFYRYIFNKWEKIRMSSSKQKTQCQICGASYINIGSHIVQTHKISTQEYYDKFMKKNDYDGLCAICGKPTPFLSLIEGYQPTCCQVCGGKYSREHGKITMIQKYGKMALNNTELMKEYYSKRTEEQKANICRKRRETKISRYGSIENYNKMQLEHCKNTKQKRILEIEQLYNATHLRTLINKYGQSFYRNNIVETFEIDDFRGFAFVKNDDIAKIENYIKNYDSNSSKGEIEVYDYIKSIYSGEILKRCRSVLHATDSRCYEIDIYVPELHIGIEYNGTYYHSDKCVGKHYHEIKSKEAELKGIRLIHIYEYEWNDLKMREKIKSMLNIAFGCPHSKIYARQCKIKQISNAEARAFNDANHLQGHKNAQITYGLFYKNALVQLMSFSYNKKNEWWEIERGCPASNNIVVGGVSKLFRHFISEQNPSQIFSYCDFNKFDGHGYETIGMQFIGYTGPDMKWILNNGDVVRRQPSKHATLKQMSRAKIWGAGSKKYLWRNENGCIKQSETDEQRI